MNFIKRFFEKLRGKKDAQAQNNECWYNNAHENGEATKNSMPLEAGGSANSFDAHVAESTARK